MLFFFCHIEKCGGTSCRYFIFDKLDCKNSDMLIPVITHNDESETNCKTMFEQWRKPAFTIFALHYSLPAFEADVKDRFFANDSEYFSCTLLRRPIERLISHYHFFDQHTYGAGRRLDELPANMLDAYCAGVGHLMIIRLSEPMECMDDRLNQAKENLAKLSLFGFVEEFDEFTSLFARVCPLPQRSIEKRVYFSNSAKDGTKASYDKDFLRILCVKCAREVEFYNFARQMYRQRFEKCLNCERDCA